jgi:hypothetical protein
MAIRLRKVLGGVQPPRARAMARKRKATEAERRARKSPTRLYKPQRDFIGIWLLLLLPYSSRAAGLPGRKSSTQQTTGLHRTMTKVCKSNGEGTFAGKRGNGEVAPKAAIRMRAIELAGSTQTRPSRPRRRVVGSAETGHSHLAHPSAAIAGSVSSSSSALASFRSAVSKPSVNQP